MSATRSAMMDLAYSASSQDMRASAAPAQGASGGEQTASERSSTSSLAVCVHTTGRQCRGPTKRCVGATTRLSPPRSPTPASSSARRGRRTRRARRSRCRRRSSRTADRRPAHQIALHHYGRFDAKCAQFADWVVLVCEDTTRGGPSSASSRSFSPRCTCLTRRGAWRLPLRPPVDAATSGAASAARSVRGGGGERGARRRYLYLSVNGTSRRAAASSTAPGLAAGVAPLPRLPAAAAAAEGRRPRPRRRRRRWPAPLEREAAERRPPPPPRAATSASTARASALSLVRAVPRHVARQRRRRLRGGTLALGGLRLRRIPPRPPPLPPRARGGYVILPALGAAAALGLAAAGARLWANAAAVAGAAAAPVVRAGLVAAAAAAATAAWRVIGFVRGRTAVARARSRRSTRVPTGSADAAVRGGGRGARPRIRRHRDEHRRRLTRSPPRWASRPRADHLSSSGR